MGALSVGRELGGGEETVQGSIRGRLGAARSLIGMDGLDQQARRIRMTRSQRRRVDPFAVSQSIPRPTQGHKATLAWRSSNTMKPRTTVLPLMTWVTFAAFSSEAPTASVMPSTTAPSSHCTLRQRVALTALIRALRSLSFLKASGHFVGKTSRASVGEKMVSGGSRSPGRGGIQEASTPLSGRATTGEGSNADSRKGRSAQLIT